MCQLLRIENQDDFQRYRNVFRWKSLGELICKAVFGINQVGCSPWTLKKKPNLSEKCEYKKNITCRYYFGSSWITVQLHTNYCWNPNYCAGNAVIVFWANS